MKIPYLLPFLLSSSFLLFFHVINNLLLVPVFYWYTTFLYLAIIFFLLDCCSCVTAIFFYLTDGTSKKDADVWYKCFTFTCFAYNVEICASNIYSIGRRRESRKKIHCKMYKKEKKKCIIISPTFLMTLQGTEVEHTIFQ